MKTMKVKIRNLTTWQTKMLRPFVTRIAREEFPGTKPSNTRHTVLVVIGYNRGRGGHYCSGHARYHSSTAYVNVPNPKYGGTFPVKDFCHLLGHEFGHCRGLKHGDMGWQHGAGGACSSERGTYSWPHYEPWASKLPVPLPVIKKAAPTTDEKRDKALTAAVAAVERWTRKKKLAETKLKIWNRRVKTLERRMATSQELRGEAACRPTTTA